MEGRVSRRNVRRDSTRPGKEGGESGAHPCSELSMLIERVSRCSRRGRDASFLGKFSKALCCDGRPPFNACVAGKGWRSEQGMHSAGDLLCLRMLMAQRRKASAVPGARSHRLYF